MFRRVFTGLVFLLFIGAFILAAMIAFGGPTPPSVHAGLAARRAEIVARLSDQPAAEAFRARDGAELSFRRYPGAAGSGVVVLVHGSSGSNAAVHSLAKSMLAAGITVFAVDVRGHGASGPRGDIAHAAQLDDDMADLTQMVDQTLASERRLLVGHSSGGGFVLHIAGGPRGCRFDGYLALSPYLNYRSPANRPDAGWAAAGVPRIIALLLVNRAGITAFDDLPVIAFALDANARNNTAAYSWRLFRNFGLDLTRWEDEIRSIDRPARVMIGASDELFDAEMYAKTFAGLQSRINVGVLPGVDHMGIILDAGAIAQVTETAREMLQGAPQSRCVAR